MRWCVGRVEEVAVEMEDAGEVLSRMVARG